MALKMFTRNKAEGSPKKPQPKPKRGAAPETGPPPPPEFQPAPRDSLANDPAKRLVQQMRSSVVLKNADDLRQSPEGEAAIEQAQRELERRMALVPAGSVSIATTLTAQAGSSEEEIEVEPFLLDTQVVTNARFQRFTDDDGYDALDYWPEEIWPHLIELKDLTGEPGPRFWQHGRHDVRLSDHPVVGVSWFEAQAYALWCGQRLPTEAEWQMAASWHINSSADLMRRFPWGDAMDNTRCNVWSSRQRTTVPVNTYPKGAAPNQVLQLVGNVWEWTSSDYSITDDDGRPVIGEMPMFTVRGGAYDTYFDTQASAQFRTGQIALGRTHNTGLRCAIDLKDAAWINGA